MSAEGMPDDRRPESKSFWRSLLEVIAPVLTAGGILLFIFLRLYYNQFYGSLGINPNDLGLGYAATLASAAGFILVILAIALYPPIIVACIYGILFVRRSENTDLPSFADLFRELKPGLLRVARVAVPLAMAGTLVVVSLWFVTKASYY